VVRLDRTCGADCERVPILIDLGRQLLLVTRLVDTIYTDLRAGTLILVHIGRRDRAFQLAFQVSAGQTNWDRLPA